MSLLLSDFCVTLGRMLSGSTGVSVFQPSLPHAECPVCLKGQCLLSKQTPAAHCTDTSQAWRAWAVFIQSYNPFSLPVTGGERERGYRHVLSSTAGCKSSPVLWSWTEIPVEAFPAPNLSPCLQNDKWWEGKGEGQWEDLSKLWTSCVARKIRRKNRLISSRIFIWLKSFYSSSSLVFSWVRLRPSPYPKMSDQVSPCGYFDFFAVNGKDSLFPLPLLPCTWLLGSCPLCLQPGQPSHTDCFRLLWCTRQVHHLSRMSRDWFLMSRAICSKVSGWNELLDLEGIINGLSILLGFQLSCCVLDSELILNTTQF